MNINLFSLLCIVIISAVHGSLELFAVVGGAECAESLYYGPQSITTSGSGDGLHEFFLSTNTVSKDFAHKEWLQIVTSDGTTELFRIYWTFSTAKTLAQRFVSVVGGSEPVSYEVHDTASGLVYTYSGTWWFSGAAGNMGSRFAASTTQCCFSSSNGVWGGGPGVVDGNTIINPKLWGLGVYYELGSTDLTCSTVYMQGVAHAYSTAVKSYMYYEGNAPTSAPTLAPSNPTALPTAAPSNPTAVPSQHPTVSSSQLPTAVPSVQATLNSQVTLFAVVGGSSCAEWLYYGPQSITTAGSADGQHEYFLSTSTASRFIPHTEWLQIVTSDGITELFRIYWTFSTAKTLSQRFVSAVNYGEAVNWRVVDTQTGQQYTYSGTWWFSNGAGSMSPRFATSTTQCCFSSDDGAWGASSGPIQANGNLVPSNFWGIGNWDSSDIECWYIYRNGIFNSYTPNAKVYMYYNIEAPSAVPTTAPSNPTAFPSLCPTTTPTTMPSNPTALPTMSPSVNPTVAPSLRPTTAPTTAPSNPTALPTIAPSSKPTAVPSLSPSAAPTVNPLGTLFAVVGDDHCARKLPYGPQSITKAGSADGQHEYFLSTATASKNFAHTEWLQIVTSYDVEQFRIYWTFSTAKTLAQRFVSAVNYGEAVNWRVVDTQTGQQYTYSGTWWFSSSAGNMAARFGVLTTQCCFSSSNGLWGAGQGSVDGDNAWMFPSSFWGIGMHSFYGTYNDEYCGLIYRNGGASAFGSKSYLYYGNEAPSAVPTNAPSNPTALPTVEPSMGPTAVPSQEPTVAPSPLPTAIPSVQATLNSQGTLFAVVGGSSCAQDLYYGPQVITTAGSAEGQHEYFLSTATADKNIAHSEWLQIVTSDGITELFRIYWTFSTAKTLADRFQAAVSSGEAVSYEVHDAASGQVYAYSGTWWFSGAAGNMGPRFAASTTQCCFSSSNGVWGGGPGVVDGNDITNAQLWGLGAHYFMYSTDQTCSTVYMQGVAHAYSTAVKSYMYYEGNVPTTVPTVAPSSPTALPTAAPTPYRLPFAVYQFLKNVDMTEYATHQALHDEVIQRATIAYLPGASLSDLRYFMVSDRNGRTIRAAAADKEGETGLQTLYYDVQVTLYLVLRGSGLTYIDVQQRLQDAFDSGAFDVTLRDTAVQYGAPGLSNASCTEIYTRDVPISDDDDDAQLLSMSAIIGIAVGGAVLLCILVSACVWWYRSTPHSTNAASIGAQQKTTSSVSADDPNPQGYDVVISAEPDKEELGLGEGELTPSAPAPDGVVTGAEIAPYTQLYSAADEEQANL